MRLLKSLVLSFSMYSKIPMPQLEYDGEDGKYSMLFFPLIGVVIGIVVALWGQFCRWREIPEMARVFLLAAIPLVITGGFHMDGFMDTADARSSYQPRERKLEILKDSHIGAFAVIRVCVYLLIYLAALSMLGEWSVLLGFSFVWSRIFSGLAVVTFRSARQEGMLFYTARSSQRAVNIVVLLIEAVAVLGITVYLDPIPALVMLGVVLLCFLYYRLMSYKVFGGITGDLAGWFVTFTECAMAVGLALCSMFV